MTDNERLIKRTQLKRTQYNVLGKKDELEDTSQVSQFYICCCFVVCLFCCVRERRLISGILSLCHVRSCVYKPASVQNILDQ